LSKGNASVAFKMRIKFYISWFPWESQRLRLWEVILMVILKSQYFDARDKFVILNNDIILFLVFTEFWVRLKLISIWRLLQKRT